MYKCDAIAAAKCYFGTIRRKGRVWYYERHDRSKGWIVSKRSVSFRTVRWMRRQELVRTVCHILKLCPRARQEAMAMSANATGKFCVRDIPFLKLQTLHNHAKRTR